MHQAGASIAAENGATQHQPMAIFGWATTKAAERYTKTPKRKKMAGDAMPHAGAAKEGANVSHLGGKSER
jgi:hypothetical protein